MNDLVERRLRVYENRIPRLLFGPKRDANGEWRRLPNEELNSLTSYIQGDEVLKIEVGSETGRR